MTDAFLDRDDALDAALRDLARARSRELTDGPSADELVDYLLGALPPEDEERVQEHLALCPECARLVLDLAALLASSPAATSLSERDRARERDRFVGRVAPGRGSPAARSRLPRRYTLALAASVVLALGLGLWCAELLRERASADRPRADVALVDLAPVGAGSERSGAAPVQVRPPRRAARLALLLNLADFRRFPRYGVELVAPGGGIEWRDDDALRGEDGTFLLEVPTADLAAPGLYRVRLRGRGAGADVPLAEYAFEVPRKK